MGIGYTVDVPTDRLLCGNWRDGRDFGTFEPN
jgi:hypothetical protein